MAELEKTNSILQKGFYAHVTDQLFSKRDCFRSQHLPRYSHKIPIPRRISKFSRRWPRRLSGFLLRPLLWGLLVVVKQLVWFSVRDLEFFYSVAATRNVAFPATFWQNDASCRLFFHSKPVDGDVPNLHLHFPPLFVATFQKFASNSLNN